MRPSIPLRNTLAYAIPELFWGMSWALAIDGPMVAAYRDAFGAGPTFVGICWFVGSLAIGIPGLFSALWVEPLKHKRTFVFWCHIAPGIALLLTAWAIKAFAAQSPFAASLAYVLGIGCFFLFIGILIPGWLALVGELFEGGKQSRVLGITFVCNKLASIFAGHFIVREVLSNSWLPEDRWSFMFLIAGAAAVIGSFPFLWIVESPRIRPARVRLGAYLRSLLTALGELPSLRRFLVADFIGITQMLVLAYAADAGIKAARIERATAGEWVAVGAAGMMLTSGLIAWRATRVHPRTWFLFGTAGGIAGALGAVYGCAAAEHGWAAKEMGFHVAAAGVGIYMGVRAACHAPLVMRLSPGRDGTAPIGVAMATIMLMQGSGPLIGALIIEHHGYLPLFVGVVACGLISFALLFLRVPADVFTRSRASGESVKSD